ncbi:MAG: metallophosphoesterase [Gammaproteobacteria bacterium]|nr:metallophosphoesterase [Gammaproteobacteria bacterium]
MLFVISTSAGAGDAQLRWSGVDRVVAFADVHGAYDELVDLLQTTGVIDDNLTWTGGKTHLVSTGDLLDRGPHSRKVVDLLMALQKEAVASGGYAHVLLGNHELMNVTGDLRYVSTQEYRAFANEEPAGDREAAYAEFVSDRLLAASESLRSEFDQRHPPGYFGLRAAFAPDGKYGQWLLERPLMIVINRTAFTHGGLPPLVASLGLEQTNRALGEALDNYVESWQQLVNMGLVSEYADATRESGELEDKLTADSTGTAQEFIRSSKSDIFDDDGPLWYRGTALCHPLLETAVTTAALNKLEVDRVVVGHTPTTDHRVTMRMDNRVVLLDTGMLGFYYKGVPSALVMKNDQINIVYPKGSPKDPSALDDPDLEQFLREAPYSFDEATNSVVLRQAGRELSAVFRAKKDAPNYAKEIAAYRIDRLLELRMVPVTVERKIAGRLGMLSLRSQDYIDESERLNAGTPIPAWCASGNDYDLMYAFDGLVGNEGRTRQSMLYFGPDVSLHLTGFGRAFGTRPDLPAYLDNAELSLAPELVRRLEMLNEDSLGGELTSLLSKRQIRAVLKRRDVMLKSWPRTGLHGQNR